jgi:hypothetical protein
VNKVRVVGRERVGSGNASYCATETYVLREGAWCWVGSCERSETKVRLGAKTVRHVRFLGEVEVGALVVVRETNRWARGVARSWTVGRVNEEGDVVAVEWLTWVREEAGADCDRVLVLRVRSSDEADVEVRFRGPKAGRAGGVRSEAQREATARWRRVIDSAREVVMIGEVAE